MAFLCERCKREVFKHLKCDYCGRSICNDCIKSSARATKTSRLIICKSCWSSIPKRTLYKSNRAGEIEVQAKR